VTGQLAFPAAGPGVPDAPLAPGVPGEAADAQPFGELLATARDALDAAAGAEDAFARGAGNLTVMVAARAQADVAVAIAAAGTQRAVQALSTVFGMQV
jgi:hypothetical protein